MIWKIFFGSIFISKKEKEKLIKNHLCPRYKIYMQNWLLIKIKHKNDDEIFRLLFNARAGFHLQRYKQKKINNQCNFFIYCPMPDNEWWRWTCNHLNYTFLLFYSFTLEINEMKNLKFYVISWQMIDVDIIRRIDVEMIIENDENSIF